MGSSTSEFIYKIKAQYQGTGEIKQLAADLESIGKIKAFEKLSADIKKTEKDLADAEKKAAAAKKALETTGTKKETSAYKAAEASVTKLTYALEKQQTTLVGYSTSLKQAGISTTELATAQKSLEASTLGQGTLFAARSTLGVRSFATIKSEIAGVQQAYAAMAASGQLSTRELTIAHAAMVEKVKLLNAEMRVTNQETGVLSSGMGKLGGIIAGAFAVSTLVRFGNDLTKLIDSYTNIDAKIRLVSDSEQEAAAIKENLISLANETGTSFEGLASAYTKLALGLKPLGVGSKELIGIFELVNKSLIVSGASTEEATSFVLQFSQAMGSGRLQGDEFRAMMESNSYFGTLLAKALDTDIAGLRKMSKDGKLTTDTLRAVFPKMAQEVEGAFGKIPATIGRSETSITNSLRNIVAEGNKMSGASSGISSFFDSLAKSLDRSRKEGAKLFATIEDQGAKGVQTLIKNLDVIPGAAPLAAYFKLVSIAAKGMGDDTKKAGDEMAAGMKKGSDAAALSTSRQKDSFAKVTPEIVAQYKKMADEIKGILDDIAGRQKSLTEELRAMARSGMSDLSAWRDRKQEAEELAAAATKAAKAADKLAAAGDMTAANEKFKEAISLADESKAAYKDLNKEVKDNDQVVVSKAEGLQTAMDGVKSSGELAIKILKEQKQAAIDAGKALDASTGGKLAKQLPDAAKKFKDVTDKAKKLTGESQHFNDQWNATWDYFLTRGETNISKLNAALNDMAKDRNITVHVSEVSGNALGGFPLAFAAGGSPMSQFRRLSNPYITAGSGLRDDVPALLKRREFVQPDWAVDYYGVGAMEAIRRLMVPRELLQGFSMGGMVSRTLNSPGVARLASGGFPSVSAGGGEVHNHNYSLSVSFAGDVSPASQANAKKQATMVLSELQRMSRRSSR